MQMLVLRLIYPTRNAQDYNVNKTKKMFSDCAIKNCGPSFWNSLDKTVKHCKTTKHFRNQLKSILLSEYNWLHFGTCLVHFCVLCFVKCSFCKFLHIFVETFVEGMIFSGLYGLLIMSSISCCVFMPNICFDVWYWNKVWYEMKWYDMIWYDMIWYDMIWYDMIWYDMIWYDMIITLRCFTRYI